MHVDALLDIKYMIDKIDKLNFVKIKNLPSLQMTLSRILEDKTD